MLAQHHYRVPDILPDSVLAPVSAVACPSTRPSGSLCVVRPGNVNAAKEDGRLTAIVAEQVRAVASDGKVPAAPLQEQVVACLAEWPGAACAPEAEVRAWAIDKALALGGESMAHQRALEVAKRQGSAERAGVSPEDVAQHVCQRWHETLPGPFATAGRLRAWAAKVALNCICSSARHLKVVRKTEKRPDEVALGSHAARPADMERTTIEAHDVRVQVCTIARHLRRLGEKVARQFAVQFRVQVLGEGPRSAAELADAIDIAVSTVYKNRSAIRRVVRDLQRAGVIDLSFRLAKPRRQVRKVQGRNRDKRRRTEEVMP
ncbi:MAG: hypothetical protein JXP73_16050 [Deltaproteobacteria bacterium]|nr:hypothetical protein [Deltaproteobacteria bacterium]